MPCARNVIRLGTRLIEYYSNVSYESDSMSAYSHLSLGDDETTAQYVVRAKVLLECIHHTTKLADIIGWDNMYLIHGLKAPYIRKRVAKEQDSWRMMEGVFQTINHITKAEERTMVYSEPNFEPMPQVSKERIHEVSLVGILNQIHPSRLIILTLSVTQDTALISQMVASIIVASPTKIRVNNLTAPMNQGKWSATTVKGSTS